MSQFFRNLLDRHQQSSLVQAESRIVAPRPKSIFEGDTETVFSHQNISFENNNASLFTDASAYLDSDDGDMSAVAVRNNRDQALAQQNTPKHYKKNIRHTYATFGDDNSIGGPGIDGHMKNATGEPHAHMLSPEPPSDIITSQNNNKKQNFNNQAVISEQRDSNSERADSQSSRPSDPLKERIQTLLQHFEEPRSGFVPSGKNSANAQEHLAARMNTDTPPLNTNTQLAQQTAKSHGLLQPPGGLAEIQSELNKHLEKISAQAPDPVVNITIDRIEVKASQPSPNTETQAKHQPSGVMSLDEYLAQRNRKHP